MKFWKQQKNIGNKWLVYLDEDVVRSGCGYPMSFIVLIKGFKKSMSIEHIY